MKQIRNPVGQLFTEAADASGIIPGPYGPIIQYLANKIPAVRREKAERMLNDVATLVGINPEALIQVLKDDDLLCELVARAVEAAMLARLEIKTKFLATVVAEAIKTAGSNSAALGVERAHLRIEILKDIEGPHVRVLHLIAKSEKGRLRWKALFLAFERDTALDPILATLTRLGLAIQLDALNGFEKPLYAITAFGREILDSLIPAEEGVPN
jgi:hypothetical protein